MVGRESWGTIVAILVPGRDQEPPGKPSWRYRSLDEGNRLCCPGMSEEELQVLLGDAVRNQPEP